MAHLLMEMVNLFGHHAAVAHSGLEGIEKKKNFNPDLILLDIMMPGMDGWTFYKTHRADSETPVIMISADESVVTRRKAEQVGVKLLPKGTEPLILKESIDQALIPSVEA